MVSLVKRTFFAVLFVLFCFILAAAPSRINLNKGASRVLTFDSVVKAEAVNKSVISAVVLTDKQVIVEGKKEGSTALNVSGKGGYNAVVMVNVREPKSVEKMIEIDVQMLEIIEGSGLNFGVDWPTLLGGKNSLVDGGGAPASPLQFGEQNPPLQAIGVFQRGPMNIFVDFLVNASYAKLLAKPKLLTENGEKAAFLSGGEIPIATMSSTGETKIEWKSYGVALSIKPVITKSGNIRASLKAEVSNLDYGNAVKLSAGGGVMPAVKTRWAETTITVPEDDTIIIAGLIQNEDAKVTTGVPVLSDIPLLGELFRNTHTEKRTTELVIFVTPRIINIGDM